MSLEASYKDNVRCGDGAAALDLEDHFVDHDVFRGGSAECGVQSVQQLGHAHCFPTVASAARRIGGISPMVIAGVVSKKAWMRSNGTTRAHVARHLILRLLHRASPFLRES
jgi:hypothetical protein